MYCMYMHCRQTYILYIKANQPSARFAGSLVTGERTVTLIIRYPKSN